MKNRCITVALLAAMVLIVSPSALAHHGNAAYDDRNPVTLIGIVTEFSWTNPHSLIYFDVKDAKGVVANWEFELGAPALQGQHAAYIERQLAGFAQGMRQNDISEQMRTIAAQLTPDERHAIATYYGAEDAVRTAAEK